MKRIITDTVLRELINRASKTNGLDFCAPHDINRLINLLTAYLKSLNGKTK